MPLFDLTLRRGAAAPSQENGKKPKPIIIAIRRKLAHKIDGIPKSGHPYNPEKRGYTGS